LKHNAEINRKSRKILNVSIFSWNCRKKDKKRTNEIKSRKILNASNFSGTEGRKMGSERNEIKRKSSEDT
jgi:hypothetical protein